MLRNQIAVINDFSGGLDTRTPILVMPLTSSPNMRNWHTSGIKNRLVKRGGFSKINTNVAPTDNLDTYYPSGYQTYDFTWRDTSLHTNISQGFKPISSGSVKQIRLWLKKTGAPTGNITISIETDSGGVPSGSSVSNGDSTNVDVTTLTTSYGWIVFTLSSNPTLVAGTQYHIVLKSSFSISGSNYVNWGADNYDVVYNSGKMCSYDGTTWNTGDGSTHLEYNACFELYIIGSTNGQIANGLFDFSSHNTYIGVFGTSFYKMDKSSLGTPDGIWDSIPGPNAIFDTYTKLLCHFDGSNGATTTVDSSSVNPKTLTMNGNAALNTGTKEFGTASASLDGTNSYISSPDSNDWNLSNNDFTIDFWIYPTASFGSYQMIYNNGTSSANENSIAINPSGNIEFFCSNPSNEIDIIYNLSTVNINAWNHIAVVRNMGTFYIFLNGIGQSFSYNPTFVNKGNGIFIGARTGTSLFFKGYIDEFRFSNGTARWTSNFTVPSSAYSGTGGNLTSSRFLTFADWQSGRALINTDLGLYTWPGTGSFSVVSAAPISKFIIIWKGYCIGFGLRGSPNGYQYSAINDYTTWPNTNIFNNAFDTNDGDVVTGVRILKGKLYVFKRYSIFRITYLGSNPTFQVDLVTGVGCPCHYTIKELDLGGTIGTVLIFLTIDKKLAIFDGYNIQIINENLTEKTNDLFSDSDTPISFSDMNFTYIDSFHAVAKEDTSEYILYCVLNSDTQVKYAFVYDWRTGGIYPYDNQNFSSSLYGLSTNKQKILYAGGYSGYMYQMESGNSDDGSAINAYWVSGKIKPQSAGLLTKLLQLFLYIKKISSGSGLIMNFQYRCDWNVTWNSVQTFNYDRNDQFAFGSTVNFDIGTIENMFQVKIQDNSTQPAGTIYGIDLFGTQLGTEVEDRAVA